ncbi:MAG: hypothetical protein OXC91_01380, partial [Rhodobacteraceae bacterium]|nr:hypothetical protein [Paracoccaceae bacterium]
TFLDHTLIWTKGEDFEMALLVGAGLIVLIVAVLFWRLAATPISQSLPIPLVIVALLFLAVGIGGLLGSPAKIAEYTAAFEQDPEGFVHAEKDRVEGFRVLYIYTIIGAAIAFAISVLIFAFTLHPLARAIAVTMAFLGLAGLVFDMFSKERAMTYADAIDAELNRLGR